MNVTLYITTKLAALEPGQAIRFDSRVLLESAQSERRSFIAENPPTIEEHAEHLAKMQGVTVCSVEQGRQWEFYKSNNEV
ncbi:MAG: hypothetical protein ACOC4K_00350 [Verrucomicrobiota bacterium]